jgi:hypothetical protein
MSNRSIRPIRFPAAPLQLPMLCVAGILLSGCVSVTGDSQYMKPVNVPDESKSQAQDPCQAQGSSPQQQKAADDCRKKTAAK